MAQSLGHFKTATAMVVESPFCGFDEPTAHGCQTESSGGSEDATLQLDRGLSPGTAAGSGEPHIFSSLPSSGELSGAAKTHKGRKGQPRLSDLEKELEQKLAHFKHLSQENEFLRHRLGMLEKVLVTRDENLGFLEQVTNRNWSQGGPTNTYTPELLHELKSTTPEQLQQTWKVLMEKASVYVMLVDLHGIDSPAVVSQSALLNSYMEYIHKMCLVNQNAIAKSANLNLQTMVPEVPPEEFWMKVGGCLKLSKEQLGQCDSILQGYEQSVQPLVADRQRLVQDLTQEVASDRPFIVETDKVDEIDQLAATLEKNLLKECQHKWDVCSFLEGVLTPYQEAKAISCSFPYMCDGMSILRACQKLGRQQAR